MAGTFKSIRRLLRVARILARHDALFLLERLNVAPLILTVAKIVSSRREQGRPGERLARALREAGPSFIKLGQALSTRSDLLGEQMAADLSQLQDAVAPFSTAEAHKAIEEEFGESVESLFASFDDEPVAAASIAQVHFAITNDGREVAVKVLRPNIETAFAEDLELFYWVAEMIEITRPDLKRLRPVDSVHTLARSIELEMDLRFEASAAAELRENFQGDDSFYVPAVDWQRTGRRVMTTERVHGISLRDIDAIKAAGHDPEAILYKSSAAFFQQVFRDGFFHADMHPGNMFVMADGTLAAVDFGIMGRIDPFTRRVLAEMLMSFLTGNYRRAAEVHFEAGWIPADQCVHTFTQACRSIGEPILDKAQNEISIARLLGQLFQITELFNMGAQPQLLLLQKTMLVAEGTGRNLAPDANMWILARPLIEEWMRDNLGPEARIREGLDEVTSAIRRLPRVVEGMEKSLTQFTEGGLRLHPDTVRAMRGERTSASGANPKRGASTVAIWGLSFAVIALFIALLV